MCFGAFSLWFVLALLLGLTVAYSSGNSFHQIGSDIYCLFLPLGGRGFWGRLKSAILSRGDTWLITEWIQSGSRSGQQKPWHQLPLLPRKRCLLSHAKLLIIAERVLCAWQCRLKNQPPAPTSRYLYFKRYRITHAAVINVTTNLKDGSFYKHTVLVCQHFSRMLAWWQQAGH